MARLSVLIYFFGSWIPSLSEVKLIEVRTRVVPSWPDDYLRGFVDFFANRLLILSFSKNCVANLISSISTLEIAWTRYFVSLLKRRVSFTKPLFAFKARFFSLNLLALPSLPVVKKLIKFAGRGQYMLIFLDQVLVEADAASYHQVSNTPTDSAA